MQTICIQNIVLAIFSDNICNFVNGKILKKDGSKANDLFGKRGNIQQ